MGFFERSKQSAGSSDPEKAAQQPNVTADGRYDTDGSDTQSLEARNEKEVQQHPDEVTADADLGIQKAEAAALVWSKKTIYFTYAWVWLCFFMLAFQSAVQTYASQAAFSEFSAAPAYSTAAILGSIIGGVLKLPIAKTLNLWGRAEGFFVFFAVYEIGMVILTSCNGPSAYAAGYTLYWIGYDALYLIMDIFIADTTGLRNRPFAFAFVQTPFIITAFTGSPAAGSLLSYTTWRWGIGLFCIVQLFVFVPLGLVFKFYQRKAEKQGLFVRPASGRTTAQSIVHYIHEFDVIGALIIMAAFILFLLPFSLVSYGRATYNSATFIAMVVVGIVLFPVFGLWEKYFARTHFLRWELFKNRTILGASLTALVVYFSFYSWELYYYNFVKVVYNLNVAMAGYMTQIYNVGSCFWGCVFGIWLRYSKRFKYECLCFGLPLLFLGAGLTIHFRGDDQAIGYVVMCQIFIAFGGGSLVIGNQMAVMAASDRSGVAMVLSILSLFNSVGGAIGQAVITAIYSKTFPDALAKMLPASEQDQVQTIYLGGYLTQEKYLPGTVERDAINYAWGQTQKWGGVSATAILIVAIPAIGMWKNYSLNKQQNKGTVI